MALLLVKTCAGLLLLVLAVAVQGSSASRVGGIFSRFWDSAKQRGANPQPTCDWLTDASKLRELQWAEKADLCFETGPEFQYPANDVATALRNDPDASAYLSYLTQCYSFQNQSYYHPWDQTVYTQDLCPVRPQLVDKVWRYNKVDKRMDHCYIVHPQVQNVAMAQCGDATNHPDAQRCKLDQTSYFRGNYYCVPDGYVKRVVLVYCPWNIHQQCSAAQVRIPTGCSCKWYSCDKARAQAQTPSFTSFSSRFRA